jgi:two-component system OmpR family response regulator
MRVLIVEDEPDLARSLARTLREETFAVDIAGNGEDGLFQATEVAYDAIVLDLLLPARDGWSVLETLRARGRDTPVLILTARDAIEDRVRGLNLGADDYLVKPFAAAELVARLRALTRRANGRARADVTIGPFRLDTAARRLTRDDVTLELTPREYAILEMLANRRGDVVTRSALCDHIYGDDTDVYSNVIDVHIASLRRKVGADLIRTRRGHGYVLDA